MKIYLDVCCLNRPFDEPASDRIRLEAEAVLSILNRGESGKLILLGSELIDFEISKIPDQERKQKVVILSSILQSNILVNEDIEKRASELGNLGFKPFDALHIAYAEDGKADFLLTTDDELLYKALQNIKRLKVKIANPVEFVMEVIKNES